MILFLKSMIKNHIPI